VTLPTLVDQAYADTDHPLLHMTGDSRPPRNDGIGPSHPKRVRGGPAWIEKEMFTVEVTAPVDLTGSALQGSARRNLATLPPAMAAALRAALEDRFQLKVHRETEQQDMYALRLGDRGLDTAKITLPVAGDCLTRAQYFDWMASAPPRPPARTIAEAEAASPRICGEMFSTMTGMEFSAAPLSMLAARLSETMERFVLDETGLDTKFNFKMRSGAGETADQRQAAGVVQLGLKLQPTKATAEYLAIDRAERPTPNEAFTRVLDMRQMSRLRCDTCRTSPNT
jgi:uncharacterized protein (TIGR03435 family)